MSKTAAAIEHYITAFNAESYKVQIKNRITDEGFWVDYSPTQLVRAITYLQGKNANGFDIYARPIGWQYVLLDDLSVDVLTDVAMLKPCMLVETSPNNFQAWLILAEIPTDRDIAKAICKQLAQRFNADLASAEPDHVGRLPGFTNRKEKYRKINGQFPFVILHRWQNRLSSFYPCGGAVLNTRIASSTTTTIRQYSTSKSSNSEQDFGVVCGLIRAGKTDTEILQHLLSSSPDLATRKGKYIQAYLQRTINNARKMSSQ